VQSYVRILFLLLCCVAYEWNKSCVMQKFNAIHCKECHTVGLRFHCNRTAFHTPTQASNWAHQLDWNNLVYWDMQWLQWWWSTAIWNQLKHEAIFIENQLPLWYFGQNPHLMVTEVWKKNFATENKQMTLSLAVKIEKILTFVSISLKWCLALRFSPFKELKGKRWNTKQLRKPMLLPFWKVC